MCKRSADAEIGDSLQLTEATARREPPGLHRAVPMGSPEEL